MTLVFTSLDYLYMRRTLNEQGCARLMSRVKFDSTLTQMSWARLESAVKIKDMGR